MDFFSSPAGLKLQAQDILEQVRQLSKTVWGHQIAHSFLLDLTKEKCVWSVRCVFRSQVYLGKWGRVRLWMYIFSWFVKGLDSLECFVSKLKPSVVVVLIRLLHLNFSKEKITYQNNNVLDIHPWVYILLSNQYLSFLYIQPCGAMALLTIREFSFGFLQC